MSSWQMATISSHPTIDAKFVIDSVKETLSINVKLDGLTANLSDIDTAVKGARSRCFRQFQHWSNGHRIN